VFRESVQTHLFQGGYADLSLAYQTEAHLPPEQYIFRQLQINEKKNDMETIQSAAESIQEEIRTRMKADQNYLDYMLSTFSGVRIIESGGTKLSIPAYDHDGRYFGRTNAIAIDKIFQWIKDTKPNIINYPDVLIDRFLSDKVIADEVFAQIKLIDARFRRDGDAQVGIDACNRLIEEHP
jgi:hypothetical protein